jgi:hypothetical protein
MKKSFYTLALFLRHEFRGPLVVAQEILLHQKSAN